MPSGMTGVVGKLKIWPWVLSYFATSYEFYLIEVSSGSCKKNFLISPTFNFMPQYHILNGDALKMQFPTDIPGEMIVARECLVDGPVNGDSLEELFANRSKFLSTAYGGEVGQDYFEKVVPEFDKILSIQAGSEVNLWFEDDLFCQVNMWFVLYLLENIDTENIYFIRPTADLRYGFGGMSAEALMSVLENRSPIAHEEVALLRKLWPAYQNDNLDILLSISGRIKERSHIKNAVSAHLDRVPKEGMPGRPEASLIAIIRELKTTDFAKVFQEFSDRESIYGFGDLQVKKLLDKVLNELGG